MRFETAAIHAGQPADLATGATVLPIHLSSTFTQEAPGRHRGYEYSRTGNPTRHALEECLAALEGGTWGVAFASGMAAINAVLSLLGPGDHVVAGADLYGGTYRLFRGVYEPRGYGFTYVEGQGPEAFLPAVRPETRLIWLESPTNPLLRLVDLRAVAMAAREHGILVAVDNTFATPYLQRPLALGADLVVHSTTKYIGGHSDLVGGIAITNRDDLHRALRFHQNAVGAVPSPFDCWLALRGVKTLAVRMRAHQERATALARMLEGHPMVRQVHYPGLPSHPQHDLARRQMAGPGGMVSCDLEGGRRAAFAFLRALRVFSLAESLGGVESLASHPATMTHASVPAAQRLRRGITPGLVRLSVGLEAEDDLREDLLQALAAAESARRTTRERTSA